MRQQRHGQDGDGGTEVAEELTEPMAQVGLPPEAREGDGHHRGAQREEQGEEGRGLRLVGVVEGAAEIVGGFADEDEPDQRGEDLVGEAREVADQRAGVGRCQDEEEESRPEPRPGHGG